MKTYTQEEFKKQYGAQELYNFKIDQFDRQQQSGVTAKDVGVGFIKGIGSTLSGLQDLGRGAMALADPTKTYSDYKQDYGIKALDNDEMLKAQNTGEKIGKVAEFAAEVLFPVGRVAQLTGLSTKGARLAGATFDGVGSRIMKLADDVTPDGTKVKEKLIDLIGGLDEKTKTALTRTPKEVFDNYVNIGRKAMMDDRNRTPLEVVGESVADALKAVKTKMSEIGAQKSSYLKLPEAFTGDGIKNFNEGLQSFINNRSLISSDKGVVNQIVTEFKKLGSTPSKSQVDKFIDFAQDALYSGEKNLTLPTSSKTISGLRNLIGKLNENLKTQLPEGYRALNQQYGELASFTKELNIRLGKEAGNAGSLVKRLFSPSDARTKELFELLGKETGQDFFRDARLAKFVMEVLGDTRSKSLLEELPSASNFIKQAYQAARQKLEIPFKAAENVIKKAAN